MFTDDSVRGFLFTRLFRADLIKELSFDPEIRICEDLLFQTMLFSSTNAKFATVSEPMYHYIQDHQSATATRKYFVNDSFIYTPAFEQISKYVTAPYVLDNYNSILDYSMYDLLNHYKLDKSKEIMSQIRKLQKEMKKTKTPLAHKSKRRIAYELAPVFFCRIM